MDDCRAYESTGGYRLALHERDQDMAYNVAMGYVKQVPTPTLQPPCYIRTGSCAYPIVPKRRKRISCVTVDSGLLLQGRRLGRYTRECIDGIWKYTQLPDVLESPETSAQNNRIRISQGYARRFWETYEATVSHWRIGEPMPLLLTTLFEHGNLNYAASELRFLARRKDATAELARSLTYQS